MVGRRGGSFAYRREKSRVLGDKGRVMLAIPPVSGAAGGEAAKAAANSRLAKVSKEKKYIAFQR